MDFLTESEVRASFLAAPPAIQSQIINLTMTIPNWLRDVADYQVWPNGAGTELVQLILRGRLPEIERGFSKWTLQTNNTGCTPCEGPNCGYNWTILGGNGLERKVTTLNERQFRSPDYCIKDIASTANFEQMFEQNVKILFQQIEFMKAINIVFNALISLSKKFVIDSEGPKTDLMNPYVYPAIGTAKLSTVNIGVFENFYEYMSRSMDAVPYGMNNGAPIFAAVASGQLFAQMWRDDPALRQDIHFSGAANDNLLKYNFMSTIRGQFFPVAIPWPRRFNNVVGQLEEVLPFINGIPMEVGNYSGLNGAYMSAQYEEILMHGMHPFTVFYKPTPTTLGSNTSFGPEPSLFNNWDWLNPQTMDDPYRRVGRFITAASIGIGAQFSNDIYGVVVERKTKRFIATFLSEPACPPTPVDCENVIPATGCPCPLILTITPDAFVANRYTITLAVPTDAVADDEIQFGLTTGGYATGTLFQKSADGKTLSVDFAAGVSLTNCDLTTLFCDNTLGCVADVVKYWVAAATPTLINLILSNPIKAATAGQTVALFYGNGTQVAAVISGTPNQLTGVWVVDPAGTFSDTVGGIVAICVPTATDATCQGCDVSPTYEQCVT